MTPAEAKATETLARELVTRHPRGPPRRTGIDAFIQEYSLSSEEGVVLMCLAEALLRVPDAETADRLIARQDRRRAMGEAISGNRSRCSSMPRPGR